MSQTKEEKDAEFDAQRDQEAALQNLPPGSQPEQRPQGTISPSPVQGEVRKRLQEAGSPLSGNQERMPREAFEKAQERAENKNYRDKVAPEAPFLPGTTAYINNPSGKGSEHHGRAVAVNQALMIDEDGLPQEYECSSRDGRAERLYVKHEHLRSVPHTEFHRTQT